MLAASLLSLLFCSIPSTNLIPSLTAIQQGPAKGAGAAETREAMKKLAFLAGRWEGTADLTQGQGGRAMTLNQSEDIRFKIGGTVLLIEGTGRQPPTADGKLGPVVFEALAVITYDPAKKGYVMRAFTERGYVNPEIEIGEEELIWRFDTPDGVGKARYHIMIDEQRRWRETGEFSRDGGETWQKFIDMSLERKTEETPAP